MAVRGIYRYIHHRIHAFKREATAFARESCRFALMFSRVLIVCTGNICRSPMAEGLLRARLAGQGGINVNSAGIAALAGHPPHPLATSLLAERHIDISAHRARQIDRVMLSASDVILVAESAHGAWVVSRFPGTRDRVHRLGKWRGLDVPDPFGRPRAAFVDALKLIDECVDDWADSLLGGGPPL